MVFSRGFSEKKKRKSSVMVRAHSLLYAIYICLLVALLCNGLLYFSNLYTQLNLHYNLQEELFFHNQSVVNYALGNKAEVTELPKEENSVVHGQYEVKQHGLISVLTAKSYIKNDTITSCQMIGNFSTNKVGLYVANLSRGISYTGNVKIIGDCFLPSSLYIQTAYINNKPNLLTIQGNKSLSKMQLPEINKRFQTVFDELQGIKSKLEETSVANDSLYFNSFKNKTKEIVVPSVLSNKIIKGNFILRNKDSIRIQKNTILEDIILMAPKISFEEGFKGTVQVFATEKITLEEKTILNYPSVVCIYNNNTSESLIKVYAGCKIQGSVVLLGNSTKTGNNHGIEIEEKGLILGDIYCTGKLNIKSNIYGSVYTNKIFHQSTSALYDNLIADVEINTQKIPPFFIKIPLFDTESTQYGIIKKIQ